MRIAVSVDTNDNWESVVAHHFGRCPHFAIVDMEGNEVQSLEIIVNPYFAHHQPGQVPSFIHEQQVNVMLCGGMGRRAIEAFQNLGVQAFTGATGTVRTALETYLGGELGGAAPCRESEEHHKHGHHH